MMMMMMPIYTLLNISNFYADADARSMTPSRNTRSYTLRSVPSSPGRSFLHLVYNFLAISVHVFYHYCTFCVSSLFIKDCTGKSCFYQERDRQQLLMWCSTVLYFHQIWRIGTEIQRLSGWSIIKGFGCWFKSIYNLYPQTFMNGW